MQNCLADPITENLEPTGYFFRELRVRYDAKEIVILKVLLSKLLFTTEILTEEEEVLLFTVREHVLSKMSKDDTFKEKNYWLMFITRHLFLNLSSFNVDIESRKSYRKQLESIFSNGRGLLSASIYYGHTIQYSVKMQSGTPKKPPEKNRIGVGYRDKGNARNPAWDGTPSWEAIATDQWFQENLEQKFNSSEKLESLYESLAVGENFPWHKSINRTTSHLVRRMRG